MLNFIIKSVLYFPAWLVVKSLGQAGLDELKSWSCQLRIDKGSPHKNFIWFFHNKPEYRSLVFFRLGHVRILKILYPAQKCLFFEVGSECIGEGLILQHAFSTIINVEKMGRDCQIWQNVTIGKDRPGGKKPVIGNCVKIFSGAVVIGDIIIGNNVSIGANAVVNKNVPDNCTVVGIPARIVKKDGNRVNEQL